VLAGVDITGLRATDQTVVTRALKADLGGPVNLEDWAKARTRLYETGVVRSADIRFQPASEVREGAAIEPVRVAVRLEERPPYRFRYGAKFGDRNDPRLRRGRPPNLSSPIPAQQPVRPRDDRRLVAAEKNQWAARLRRQSPVPHPAVRSSLC
jgi:hypothetical protein